jgi:hypothetical protein
MTSQRIKSGFSRRARATLCDHFQPRLARIMEAEQGGNVTPHFRLVFDY